MAEVIETQRVRSKPGRGTGGLVLALFLLMIGISLIGRMFQMDEAAYNVWGGVLVGPMLIAISLPILAREARKLGNPRLVKLFAWGLVLMLLGSIIRYVVTYEVYGGKADATGYHSKGVLVLEEISSGNWGADLESYTRTDFIRYFTGLAYFVISPTLLGGFMFYAWLAFWGLFFFFKAFATALPTASIESYGKFVFFYPSLLYWPATIGKDAWMLLWLGVASYGVALALRGKGIRGFPYAALGMGMAGIVRVPVAGMVGLGLAAAFVVRKPSGKLGHIAPLVKIATVAAMIPLVIFMIGWAGDFLNADLTSTQSVTTTLEQTSGRTEGHGGSAYDSVVVTSPADVPLAMVTVLFRPFIFEAHNFQAAITAAEGMVLLAITLLRWRWLVEALKSLRRHPYIVYAASFVFVFMIAFSSFPNFGLLARQRVQLFPFYFVLFCVPPAIKSLRTKREVAKEEHP
jgi:hypothetical protein